MSKEKSDRASSHRDATPNTGKRVLIVEDSYPVADSLKYALELEGYEVVGMAATVATALELIETSACEFAILDVDLCGQSVVPVARQLVDLGTPFMFLTGFGDSIALPSDLADTPRLEKPAVLSDILDLIAASFAKNA